MTKMTAFMALALAAPALALTPAHAQDTADAEAAPAYSVETTRVEVLLDNPVTAAILERLIPTVYANDLFQTMGRSQTLKAIQQYEPAVLTDEKLAEIQAEFDALAE